MQKVKRALWVAALLLCALCAFPEDVYSAYKRDFAAFKRAVQTEYDNFAPLQNQYPDYFQIVARLKAECEAFERESLGAAQADSPQPAESRGGSAEGAEGAAGSGASARAKSNTDASGSTSVGAAAGSAGAGASARAEGAAGASSSASAERTAGASGSISVESTAGADSSSSGGAFRTQAMNLLVAEYLYQKTQVQSQTEGALVFGFVGIALFGIAVVLTVIIYFVFINEAQKQGAIMSAIISEIEKERSRISRELHDTVAQDLRASTICQSSAQKNELEMKAIADIRSICFNLNPPGLEEERLDRSITELCANFQKETGIETNLFIDGRIDFADKLFTAENKVNIYRIIQESLNNAQKHSGSDSVSVTMQVFQPNPRRKPNGKIAVEISDDGAGFDTEKLVIPVGHFGFNSMKQRAKLLNGRLAIASQKDCGTVVRLELGTTKDERKKATAVISAGDLSTGGYVGGGKTNNGIALDTKAKRLL